MDVNPKHPDVSDSAFWRFSLRFYALPDVAAACIDLQDQCGVDVNVLLFFLFLADQGRAVSPEDARRIDAGVRSWREGLVMPLRAARRNLRTPADLFDPAAAEELRAKVKRIELEAERMQQETLERTHPAAATGRSEPSRAVAARTNLAAYGACLGELPDDLLAPLVRAFDAASAVPR